MKLSALVLIYHNIGEMIQSFPKGRIHFVVFRNLCVFHAEYVFTDSVSPATVRENSVIFAVFDLYKISTIKYGNHDRIFAQLQIKVHYSFYLVVFPTIILRIAFDGSYDDSKRHEY